MGINTNSPSDPLTVNGVIRSVAGGYEFPDGTLQTTAAVGGGGGGTLDEAYDEGGLGAGRTITADAGAVNIDGPDGLTVNGRVGIGTTGPFLSGSYYLQEVGVLPSARGFMACAGHAASGKTYCFGGVGPGPLDEIVEYDPVADTVTVKSAVLPSARTDFSCAGSPATGTIFCFGGIDSQTGSFLDQIVEYDPGSDSMAVQSAVLPSARGLFSCDTSSANGKTYCFGGLQSSGLAATQIVEYDPVADTLVAKAATLPYGTHSTSCADNPATSKIYCVGGQTDIGISEEIVEYDPIGDSLTVAAPLPEGLHSTQCVTQPATGNIVCFGGYRTSGFVFDEVLEYDAGADALTVRTLSPLTGLVLHGAAASSVTGSIYFFGGHDGSEYQDGI